MSAPCGHCGLPTGELTPLDAVRLVRTLPYRYRKALGYPAAADGRLDDPASAVRRRPAPGAWSPVEHFGLAVDVLDVLAPAIRRAVVEDEPEVWLFDPAEQVEDQAYDELPVAELVSRLDTACADLSLTIDDIDPAEWARGATVGGTRATALELLRRAVHEAVHHLDDLERALAGLEAPGPGPP